MHFKHDNFEDIKHPKEITLRFHYLLKGCKLQRKFQFQNNKLHIAKIEVIDQCIFPVASSLLHIVNSRKQVS